MCLRFSRPRQAQHQQARQRCQRRQNHPRAGNVGQRGAQLVKPQRGLNACRAGKQPAKGLQRLRQRLGRPGKARDKSHRQGAEQQHLQRPFAVAKPQPQQGAQRADGGYVKRQQDQRAARVGAAREILRPEDPAKVEQAVQVANR